MKLQNREILAGIARLKSARSIDSQEVTDLAGFGGEVVPYMLRLAGQRKLYCAFMASDVGLIGFPRVAPYRMQATWVISKIRDISATPNLLKISATPLLGGPARLTLAKINAVLTREEVQKIVDSEKNVYMLVYRLHDLIEPLVEKLNSDEAAMVLSSLLRPGILSPFVSIESAANLHHLDGRQIQLWKDVVGDLGATNSRVAFEKLSNQLTCLIGNAGGPAHELKELMIEEYRRALSNFQNPVNVVGKAGCQLDLGPTINQAEADKSNAQYESFSRTWQFSFSVVGNSKKVRLTVNLDGAPITDIDGVLWSEKDVELQPGGPLAFEKKFHLVWAHCPPLGHYPTFHIQAKDIRDNSSEILARGYWGGTHGGTRCDAIHE